MTWRAILDHDRSSLQQGLRIVRYNRTDTVSHLVGMTFTDMPDGAIPPREAVLLKGHDAIGFLQAMMDAAYEMGLRPSRAQDERHIKAHLEDMRRFAFHVIKEKP